jgi:adenylyltransferase/sulfurtransferase
VLFGVKDVGRPKAVVAADRLMEQFQPVRILARKQRFEVGDVGQVFPEVDLVLDCSDHIQTKYLLNDAAFLSGKPLIQAGLSQWQGQLGVLDPRDPSRGCLRCLWPHPGDERAQGTCAQVGILGPVAGILGAHQAMEAIKWLLALPTTKGWHRFDLLAMRFHALGRRRNPKCRLCGDSPELRTLEAEAYRGVEACRPLERPWSEVQASLAAGQGRVVDVRESFEREFLPMACLWQSYSALVASTSDLSADRPLYLVCQKGIKSYWLAERVRLGGGGSVFSVQGGWETFPQG